MKCDERSRGIHGSSLVKVSKVCLFSTGKKRRGPSEEKCHTKTIMIKSGEKVFVYNNGEIDR